MNINATLLAQIIIFALFVWFCLRFIWPPLMTALTERQKIIADGLASADQGRRELEKSKEQVEAFVQDAKQKSLAIISSAEKRASEIVEEAKLQAKAESDRAVLGAKAEINLQRDRMKEELRSQVSILVISGVEKILHKEIDRTAHAQILSQLIENL